MTGTAFYEKVAFGIRALGVNLKQALCMKSSPKRIARQRDPQLSPFPLWREGNRDTKHHHNARSPHWKGM